MQGIQVEYERMQRKEMQRNAIEEIKQNRINRKNMRI